MTPIALIALGYLAFPITRWLYWSVISERREEELRDLLARERREDPRRNRH